jgi:hypothetical protein
MLTDADAGDYKMLERLGHVLCIVHTLVERSAAQVLCSLLSLLALLVQKYKIRIVHTLVERSTAHAAAKVLSLLLNLLDLLVQKCTCLTPAELLFLQGAAHAARASKGKTDKRGNPKAQEDHADGIARIRRRIVRLLDGMLLRGHAADVNAVSAISMRIAYVSIRLRMLVAYVSADMRPTSMRCLLSACA